MSRQMLRSGVIKEREIEKSIKFSDVARSSSRSRERVAVVVE